MFQPFLSLNKQYLNGLIKLKKTYLVSQSYKRGQDHFLDDRTPILFTDYGDLGQAQIHLSAIKGNDKLAAIVDLTKPEHLEKVQAMFGVDSNYIAYWSVVKEKDNIQKRLSARYIDNIRRHIDKNTNWRIGSKESMNVNMQIIYGEIFVDLRYRTHQIRIKFEDIERT